MDSEPMTMEQMAGLVRAWFGQAGQANGPLLPDGWFGGRPHENTFFLAEVQVLGESLVIQMSEDTTLRLEHPKRAYVEKSELIFDGYGQAVLRWKHYGGGPDAPYHEKNYGSGQVRLVPPFGTKVLLGACE
ncbi:MAG: hypothetical protein ACYCXT_13635 [Acidiferrobacteraceae bacterium]